MFVRDLPSTDCPVLSSVRAAYGDWHVDPHHAGYIRYYLNGRTCYEHRLVAACLEPGLTSQQQIHHHNADAADNRAANIRIVSRSEHGHIHKGHRQWIRIICPICLSFRSIDRIQWQRRQNHFCSPVCSQFAQRKIEWPSPAELYDLMVTINNWRAIGRLLGVSDNAVRKRAKHYGLDLSICNGRCKRSG